jgi:hypothetical protein
MRTALYEAVALFAPIEWARSGTIEKRPPFVAWRFVAGHEGDADKIIQIVGAFSGEIEWCAYHEGRNWVIEPKQVRDFRERGDFRTDVDASDAFAAANSALVERMHADADALAEELRRIIQPN